MQSLVILISIIFIALLVFRFHQKSTVLDAAINMLVAKHTYERIDKEMQMALRVKLNELARNHGLNEAQIGQMQQDPFGYWMMMVNTMRGFGIKPSIPGALHNDEFALPFDAYKKLTNSPQIIFNAQRVLRSRWGVEVSL